MSHSNRPADIADLDPSSLRLSSPTAELLLLALLADSAGSPMTCFLPSHFACTINRPVHEIVDALEELLAAGAVSFAERGASIVPTAQALEWLRHQATPDLLSQPSLPVLEHAARRLLLTRLRMHPPTVSV